MSKKVYSGISVGSRTDTGEIREHNEDSLLVKDPLFVIADGMGGHAAGEVASELAVKAFEKAEIDSLDINTLKRAVAEANIAILRGAQAGLGRMGMGTTLTAAVIEKDSVLVAQVGDSRAYIMQNGELRQVTRDHSLVEELLSSGQITEEEAVNHPNRSVITRALGIDNNIQADTYELRLHDGDRMLLCSDGLNTMLDDEEIESVLLKNPDPQAAADALVEAAKVAGGFDNITVIVININSVDAQSEAKRKRRFIRNIVAFVLVFVLLISAAIGGIYLYAQNSAFLIAENDRVVVYRGLPGDFMGLKFRWIEKTTDISVTQLSETVAGNLKNGIEVGTLDNANKIITDYENQIKKTTR